MLSKIFITAGGRMAQKNRPQAETLYGLPQPLQSNLYPNIISRRAPTAEDIGYPLGQGWVDKTGADFYVLVNVAAGVATWALAAADAGPLNTLTGDSGGAISPVSGNIDILGGSGVVVDGTAGTLTISLTGGGTAMDSFVPDAGTNPVVPTALGAVTMAGTANQITTTGGLNSLTFSVPSAFIAPGSIAATTTVSSTTTMTAGTGLTVTTGNLAVSAGNANVTGNVVASKSASGSNVTVQATNSDNTSGTSNAGVEIAAGGSAGGDPYLSFQISGVGASTMTMGLDNSASDTFVISNSATIGTSNALTLTQAGALGITDAITAGTGITATTGDIAASSGNVSASGTVTGGTGVTATTGDVTATAGAVNAGTSMTATLGDITATNGNLSLATAGNKIIIATGANASVGTSGVMSGSPGAVTVATTACSATAKVFYCRATTGGTPGDVSITAQDGTGFTLTSTGDETSTFNWWIINA